MREDVYIYNRRYKLTWRDTDYGDEEEGTISNSWDIMRCDNQRFRNCANGVKNTGF